MIQQVAPHHKRERLLPLFIGGYYMKSLDDMLHESTIGTKRQQELFAEQYNKVSNMLYNDYGIQSIHLTFIVRDILDRVYSGEKIVSIDITKMIHYNSWKVVPDRGSTCYIIPRGRHEEILADYSSYDDLFIDDNGKKYHRIRSVQAWRYREEDET